jgi:hypothetical protein
MKTIFTLIFISVTVISFAQTKRIAHRSHSGRNSESYISTLGSYGKVAPRKVKVHLESGRDTMVYEWDSLARPYYLRLDLQPKENEVGKKPIENAKEVGHVAGKLVM